MENENRELEEISEVSDDYEENGLSLSRGRDWVVSYTSIIT